MKTLFATTSRKVTAIVLAVVLILCAAIFGTFIYFQAHALPHTQAGDIEVSGMTPDIAVQAVQAGFGDPEVTVAAPGGDVTVPLSEMGLALDPQGTVDQIFDTNASPAAVLSGLINGSNFLPKVTVDTEKFAEFVASLPVVDATVPQDAQITFVGDHFQVTPAVSGQAIDARDLSKALVTAAQSGGTTVTAVTGIEEPAVSTTMAEAAAQQADAWLTTSIHIDDDDTMEITADIATIASWVSFDKQGGQLVPVVNEASVKTWVEDFAKTTDIVPGEGIHNTDASGAIVATVIEPTKGWIVNNTAAVADSIVRALPTSTAVTASFDYDEVMGKWTERAADPATEGMIYRAAPGEKWLTVDIDNAVVTTYEGAEIVGSFPVVAGKPSTPTATGEYNIYLQYNLQDMGCTAEWSYCAKDVPWVSYFTGSYALHGSSSWQSGFGNPGTRFVQGSAGCVNMRNEDALTVFEWVDMGTKVISF